jgi:Na+/H+-dicarboxylate symporter
MQLYTKILIGMLAGIFVGYLFNIIFDKEKFAEWDKNGDTFITYQEFEQSAQGLTPEVQDFISLDSDNNQTVTRDEYIGSKSAILSLPPDFASTDLDSSQTLTWEEVLLSKAEFDYDDYKSIDKNSDQVLTAAEYDAARSAFIAARDEFAGIEQDGDDALSQQEFLDHAPPTLRAEAVFMSLDKNGDEKITKPEFKSKYGWARFTTYLKPIGDIFIRLIKMLVVPLVLVSLILGSAGLGDIRKVGSIGLKSFGLFMVTTAIAVLIGLGVANLGNPGTGLPEDKKQQLIEQYESQATAKASKASDMKEKSQFQKVTELFVRMVPLNPFEALAKGDMLGVIFFALFLGICMTLIPSSKAEPLIRAFDGLNDAVIKMVTLAMETAPYGVFALMVDVVATLGLDVLVLLVKYALIVIAGLLLHVILTHLTVIYFYLRQSPILFIRAVKEALVFGFSTSSSSATLPISMNVAENNLGVSKEVSSFVLPLGATVNMDGTALYQAIAAIFIAQVYSIDLDFASQMTIVLTATLASVGAAGVPGAGMITLALVLSSIGVPEAGIALIFGLDRILDMCRTTININGNLMLAALIAKSEGEDVKITTGKDMIPG